MHSARVRNNTRARLFIPAWLSEICPVSIHAGCPIHAISSGDWAFARQRKPLPPLNAETVISTEAAHGFIVSSEAEKSASLPLHPSSLFAHLLLFFHYLPSFVLPSSPQTRGCPIHRALCDGWD